MTINQISFQLDNPREGYLSTPENTLYLVYPLEKLDLIKAFEREINKMKIKSFSAIFSKEGNSYTLELISETLPTLFINGINLSYINEFKRLEESKTPCSLGFCIYAKLEKDENKENKLKTDFKLTIKTPITSINILDGESTIFRSAGE